MYKKKKNFDNREELLSSSETEFVIMNSPDDSPTDINGDEKSMIKVDNPDDLDAKFRK